MRTLAMNQFVEEFGELLSVRAEVTFFERSLIEATYEQIWFVRERKDEWARRVRAAFHFLDQGALESPKGVSEHFFKYCESIGNDIELCTRYQNGTAR